MNATVALKAGIFDVEQEDDTIIVIPTLDLRELDYKRIQEGAKEILDLLNDPAIKKVILDFSNVSYMDSSGLGALVGLWVSAKKSGCELQLVSFGQRIRELLRLTKLDELFSVSRFPDTPSF